MNSVKLFAKLLLVLSLVSSQSFAVPGPAAESQQRNTQPQQEAKPPGQVVIEIGTGKAKTTLDNLVVDYQAEIDAKAQAAIADRQARGEPDQEGKYIFGREGAVDSVANAVAASNVIFIEGDSKVGKTGVAEEFFRKHSSHINALRLNLSAFNFETVDVRYAVFSKVIKQINSNAINDKSGKLTILYIDPLANIKASDGFMNQLIATITDADNLSFKLMIETDTPTLTENIRKNAKAMGVSEIVKVDGPAYDSVRQHLAEFAIGLAKNTSFEMQKNVDGTIPRTLFTPMAIDEAAKQSWSAPKPFKHGEKLLNNALFHLLKQQQNAANNPEVQVQEIELLQAQIEQYGENPAELSNEAKTTVEILQKKMEVLKRNYELDVASQDSSTPKLYSLLSQLNIALAAQEGMQKMIGAQSEKSTTEKVTGWFKGWLSQGTDSNIGKMQISNIDLANQQSVINDLRVQIANTKQEIAAELDQKAIDSDDIIREEAKLSGRDPRSLKGNFRAGLENFDDLKKIVFEQDHVIDRIGKYLWAHEYNLIDGDVVTQTDADKMILSGLQILTRPIGVFFFAGPSGSGKTKLSTEIGNILGIPTYVVGMESYKDRSDLTRFSGAPPSYVGYGEPGAMEKMHQDTGGRGVIVFDEIEKAHPDVRLAMLGLMDTGIWYTGDGKKLDFRKSILIFTSNLGQDISKKKDLEELREFVSKETGIPMADIIRMGGNNMVDLRNYAYRALVVTQAINNMNPETYKDAYRGLQDQAQSLKKEFVGRIQQIHVFNQLSSVARRKIAEQGMAVLASHLEFLSGTRARIVFTENSRAYCESFFSDDEGARGSKRYFEQQIATEVTTKLRAGINPGDTLVIDADLGELDLAKQVKIEVVPKGLMPEIRRIADEIFVEAWPKMAKAKAEALTQQRDQVVTDNHKKQVAEAQAKAEAAYNDARHGKKNKNKNKSKISFNADAVAAQVPKPVYEAPIEPEALPEPLENELLIRNSAIPVIQEFNKTRSRPLCSAVFAKAK